VGRAALKFGIEPGTVLALVTVGRKNKKRKEPGDFSGTKRVGDGNDTRTNAV